MKNLIFCFFLWVTFFSAAYSQQEIPYVINYNRINYAAAGQNWAVDVDSDGRVYFGNSDGLLQYDGSAWKLYSLPNESYVRSVAVAPDERIYVGSFEEFGYFEKNKFGKLIYKSLSDSLVNYTLNNEEIWSIACYDNKIYFRSFGCYFLYDCKTKQVSTVTQNHILILLKNINDKLYAFNTNVGLSVIKNNEPELLIPASDLNNDKIIGVVPSGNNKLIIASAKSGLFVYDGHSCKTWSNEANEMLKSASVNQIIMTQDSVYIVGTIVNGVCAIDKTGKLIWRINTGNGLQNNTILRLAKDNRDNIWVATDNGISFIRTNSQIRFVNSFKQNIGNVYSAAFKDGYVYMATNQGLFCGKQNKELYDAELMNNLSEQAWYLMSVDEQLFCGHQAGTFEIMGGKAVQVSSVNGGTCMRKAYIRGQEVLVQSSYTALSIFKKNASGKWIFSHKIPKFRHPIRRFEVDNQGNIWASHFHKGLYKIRLSEDLRSVEKVDYYPALVNDKKYQIIRLFKVADRVIFNAGSCYFTYDDLQNKIIPYQHFNNIFSEYNDINNAVAVNADLYWFIRKNEFMEVEFKNNEAHIKQRIPFSDFYGEMPDKNENVIPVSKDKSVFCLNNGIAILDKRLHHTVSSEKYLFLESVKTFNKNEINDLPINPSEKVKIAYNNNNIIFDVAYNCFSDGNVNYEFKLKGLEQDFVLDSLAGGHKEYNRLHWGNYTLYVTAKDDSGNVLASLSYSFVIEPPFYASKTAVVCYIAFILLLIVAVYKYIIRKIKNREEKFAREQERLRKEEFERQEKEIIKLKNRNLESELTFKSKELASSTMLIIRKKEALSEIKDELQEQKQKLGLQYPNKHYDKLVKMIDQNLSSEDDWEIFRTNFDRIHESFFRNLKATYPQLTPNDLKLCALLRLNMSSKDIANLLSISPRSVEVARSRLRKKLNITPEKNLIEFMIEFK